MHSGAIPTDAQDIGDEWIPEAQRLAAELISMSCHKDSTNTADSKLPAGYTYLAQLVAHDLSFSIFKSQDFTAFETPIRGARTKALDLDGIYGGGPGGSPWLYTERNGQRSRFLLGRLGDAKPGEILIATNENPALGNDFARLMCPVAQHEFAPLYQPNQMPFRALTPDQRNLDTIVLSQITLFFVRLHNHFDDLLQASGDPALANFKTARMLTEHVYRKIIFLDLFGRWLDSSVFEECRDAFQRGEPRSKFRNADFTKPAIHMLPFVLRVGHFMVRKFYNFNEHHPEVAVGRLMQVGNPTGRLNAPLGTDWTIDFSRFFFEEPGTGANFAHPIDGKVTDGVAMNFKVLDGADSGARGLVYRDLMRWRASAGTRNVNKLPRRRNIRALLGEHDADFWSPQHLREFLEVDAHIPVLLEQAAARPGTDPVSQVDLEEALILQLTDLSPTLFAMIECMSEQSEYPGTRLGPLTSAILAAALLEARPTLEFAQTEALLRQLLARDPPDRMADWIGFLEVSALIT